MQKLPALKNYKVILVALLAGITIFSVYKYVQALKEKYELLNTLILVKNQVAILEVEKQNLLQTLEKQKQLEQRLNDEKAALKKNLKAAGKKVNSLNSEVGKINASLERVTLQVASLEGENTALKDERDKLAHDNDNLQAKLGSVGELRKAIRELRRQTQNLGTGMREYNESTQGNQGFVIRDGKSTTSGKVKIEVTPAPPTPEPATHNQ